MEATKSELCQLLLRNDLLKSSLTVSKISDNELQVGPYVEKVMAMASTLWRRCLRLKQDSFYKVEVINKFLFSECGFEGKGANTKQIIDDPRRFYLHSLLETKSGSSLTVTILYAVLAEQIGLSYECIAMPHTFLLRITDVATEAYIDPFDGGKLLNVDDFQKKFQSSLQRNRMLSTNIFEKLGTVELVGRQVQQLKHAYILKGKALEALRAVEVLSTLFPDSPEVARDRGILYCEMEYFSKAMEDLTHYLHHRPHAEDVGEIKKLASMLKGCREIMN